MGTKAFFVFIRFFFIVFLQLPVLIELDVQHGKEDDKTWTTKKHIRDKIVGWVVQVWSSSLPQCSSKWISTRSWRNAVTAVIFCVCLAYCYQWCSLCYCGSLCCSLTDTTMFARWATGTALGQTILQTYPANGANLQLMTQISTTFKGCLQSGIFGLRYGWCIYRYILNKIWLIPHLSLMCTHLLIHYLSKFIQQLIKA